MELPIMKIKQQKRSKMIVEEIISLIASDKLKQGDRLPSERTLAEEFGVSRATLREALSSLELVGVIQMRTGGGSYVTNLDVIPFLRTVSQLFTRSSSMLNDLIELRSLFEIQAVRLIIQNNKREEITAVLGEIVQEMEQSFFANATERSVEADIRFHKALYKLSGNKILEKAGEAISAVLESSVRFNRSRILRDENNKELLYNQHYLIYKSILSGGEEIAVRTVVKHLNLAKEMQNDI